MEIAILRTSNRKWDEQVIQRETVSHEEDDAHLIAEAKRFREGPAISRNWTYGEHPRISTSFDPFLPH